MTTLIVNIEDERDVPAITDLLNRPGVTYSVGEDDHNEELEASLKRAEEDSKAGRVRPHDVVWAEITAKYDL